MKVNLADGKNCSVKGIGHAIIQDLSRSTSLSLSNVLYVPEPKQNLISVGQLTTRGVQILYAKDNITIKQNETLFELRYREILTYIEGKMHKNHSSSIQAAKAVAEHICKGVAANIF